MNSRIQNIVLAISLSFAFWHLLPNTRRRIIGATFCRQFGHSKRPNIQRTENRETGTFTSVLSCMRCGGGQMVVEAQVMFVTMEDLLGGMMDLPDITSFEPQGLPN